MFDIAIVGLGATGISLLKAIQEQVVYLNLPSPRIAVINPLHSFAKGEAFGCADSIHKVNTPPHMLNLLDSEPQDFSYWLKKNHREELYPNR